MAPPRTITRADRPAKPCAHCGELFWRPYPRAQWARTHHCSVKCGKASKKKDMRDRIEQNSIPEPNSGCWLWTGAITQWGYAQISIGRKTAFAHRCSYEAFNGMIPRGLLACHTCDNRVCVNPDHLYAGTHKDNNGDAVRRFRRASTFTRPDILNIREDARPTAIIAKEYGVSKTTISNIKTRETWWLIHG